MAKEKNKKSKKPFLIAGITLLALAVYTGIGYAITGSVTFLRDMTWTTGLTAAGTAVGVPLYVGGKALFTKVFTKNKSRARVHDLEKERVEGMDNIPQNQETLKTKYAPLPTSGQKTTTRMAKK